MKTRHYRYSPIFGDKQDLAVVAMAAVDDFLPFEDYDDIEDYRNDLNAIVVEQRTTRRRHDSRDLHQAARAALVSQWAHHRADRLDFDEPDAATARLASPINPPYGATLLPDHFPDPEGFLPCN